MRHPLLCWTLLLASVAAVTGCTLPYETQHQHVARFATTVQRRRRSCA